MRESRPESLGSFRGQGGSVYALLRGDSVYKDFSRAKDSDGFSEELLAFLRTSGL